MKVRHPKKTARPLPYYKAMLLCIAQGLVSGETDQQIVERLRNAGLRTQTGLKFTSNLLRQLLKSLRNPTRYPSLAYRALKQLHADRQLTSAQCRPLLRIRGGAI